ncbi:MAG: hypothetical protein SGJ18_10600 [Pseudomonadota bacterium]|nr:hypothetical protein [Pseudomonadota bacterium]
MLSCQDHCQSLTIRQFLASNSHSTDGNPVNTVYLTEGFDIMYRLLTVLTIFVSAQAFAKDEIIRKSKKKIVPAPLSYQWPNGISAEYTPQTKHMKDSSLFYYFDFNYHPSYTHHFRWFQRVSHILTAEQGKDNSGEVMILNPRLNYYYNFQEPIDKSYHLALRLGSELGTSPVAKADGINANSVIRLEFDKRFSMVTASLRPYVGYWSTQYSTNHLGEPLPMFTVGHNFYVTTRLTPKLSWNIELDTAFFIFQPDDVQEGQNSAPPSALPLETTKTSLYFGSEIGYMLLKNLQVRVGYYQFDKFMSDGKFELELLSSNTTRYLVGLDYSF